MLQTKYFFVFSAGPFEDLTGDINAIVSHTGSVTFIPHVIIKSFCKINEKKLKKNKKITCTLKFGSWTYGDDLIDVQTPDDVMDLSSFDTSFNRKWKLLRTKVKRVVQKYACCEEPYIHLRYDLILKRRP